MNWDWCIFTLNELYRISFLPEDEVFETFVRSMMNLKIKKSVFCFLLSFLFLSSYRSAVITTYKSDTDKLLGGYIP
jgi:hypothetical protein